MIGDQLVPIRCGPGIKRDGTTFEGGTYIDAQWCRWQRNLPRKMGGYRAITQNLQGPIYGTHIYSAAGVNRIYTGSSSALEYTDVTGDGIGGGVGNRTPATLAANNDNIWTFAVMYDGGGSGSILFAHAAPNMAQLDSTTNTQLWYGPVMGSTALVAAGDAPLISGGVLTAPPYGIVYGNDGLVNVCVPNTPNSWNAAGSNLARVTQLKIVYGAQTRAGAGVAPSFLLWSLDSLIRATFAGGTAVFNYDTISSQISIMSSRSVVEYNGTQYWMGQDKFFMYNGVVQEIRNVFNRNYLFDNINWNARQKIWGHAVDEFGEIWWHVPFGDATECTHVIIFNIAEGMIWYDTELSRTSGFHSSVFRWPVMVDSATSELTMVRLLSGTPASSAGVAANAFDGDNATTCNAGVDGNISYDYGQFVTKHVHQVGIRPAAAMTATADIVFEYSIDTGASPSTWQTLYTVDPSQTWTASTDYLFTLSDNHTVEQVRAVRVVTSGGATLAVEEFYINGHGTIMHQHEFGKDAIIGTQSLAIPSYFETADISWAATGPVAESQEWVGEDKWLETIRLEPDFIQVGQMSVEVNGRAYPKSELVGVDQKTFEPDTEKVDFKTQFRIVRFKFESNTLGGDYQMGQPIIKIGKGDARQ